MHTKIKDNVDGVNLKTVLTEFGTRLFNTIVNHIKSFSYNLTGRYTCVRHIYNNYNVCRNNAPYR